METKKAVQMSGLDLSGRCLVDDLQIEWARAIHESIVKQHKRLKSELRRAKEAEVK